MPYRPGELSPCELDRAKPATLQPVTVREGFRPAWVRWFYAKDGWDSHSTFVGERVFTTEAECLAEIALIKARAL